PAGSRRGRLVSDGAGSRPGGACHLSGGDCVRGLIADYPDCGAGPVGPELVHRGGPDHGRCGHHAVANNSQACMIPARVRVGRKRSSIMRDFTKSVFGFSWALSLFGVQQTLNLLKPSKASQAFEKVTDATKDEIGDTLKAAFKAGDTFQRGFVDLTLGLFTGRGLSPSRWMKTASDVMNQSAEAIGQGLRPATTGGQHAAPGGGPVPNPAQGQAQDSRASGSPGPAPRGGQGWGPMPASDASSR